MTCLRAVGGVLVLGLAAFATWEIVTADDEKPQPQKEQQAESQEQKKQPPAERDQSLRHFMRLKLTASSMILEGLSVEDFGLIKQGASKLNEMSTTEKWRVSNDALYRNFSGDFQRVTKDLVKAAEDENLDRAALKWVDATMGCIECHRYARGMFIASADKLDTK